MTRSRRRVLMATAVVVLLVIGGAIGLSGRSVDPRFVGSWQLALIDGQSIAGSQSLLDLKSDGTAEWQQGADDRTPGDLLTWSVENSTLELRYDTHRRLSGVPDVVAGMLEAITGGGARRSVLTYDVVEGDPLSFVGRIAMPGASGVVETTATWRRR